MEERKTEPKAFVSYEYKEITAEKSQMPLLLDGYECFGWEVAEARWESAAHVYGGREHVQLKRERHILNKTELTRLQRNFEACVREIGELERAKGSKATIYALVIALLGTAFMAGATFAVTSRPPHVILCILLAIPGFAGWIFPAFVHGRVQRREIKRLTPLIEAKYDEIDEICEKGSKLLYQHKA